MKKVLEREKEFEPQDVPDVVSAVIDAIWDTKETIQITVLTDKIFKVESTPEGLSKAIKWLKFRDRLSPMRLVKVEFSSEKKDLYFIKAK